MLTVRKSEDRGYADHGWLKSYHSFSFAGYYDSQFMGFGNLRVINEDYIAPGKGFATHGHRDMEIVTYVLQGSLAHKDSIGNVTSIPAGDVQRMSAGSGVQHSEFNDAPEEMTHLFQIWIEPHTQGVEPSYEQKTFSMQEKQGALRLIVSPDGAQGSVRMSADARLWSGLFDGSQTATLNVDPRRKQYVQVLRGTIDVNARPLNAGDAAMLKGESQVRLAQGKDSEVLVFDLRA